jgi:phosphoglycolate phosphatase
MVNRMQTSLQNIDVVLWDWNGTLLDDVDFTFGCLNWMLAEHGYPQRYDMAAYRELFDFPIEDYYLRAGFDFSKHPYPMLAERFMAHYNAGVPGCGVMPGAAAALQALQAAGKRQLVLSASRRDYLVQQVAARGLTGYFDALLGLDDIYGASKVQLGLDWMQAAGVDPARCVMIGDTTHDAAVAKALGAQCILLTCGHQSRARLQAVCDIVLDGPEAAAALLLGQSAE